MLALELIGRFLKNHRHLHTFTAQLSACVAAATADNCPDKQAASGRKTPSLFLCLLRLYDKTIGPAGTELSSCGPRPSHGRLASLTCLHPDRLHPISACYFWPTRLQPYLFLYSLRLKDIETVIPSKSITDSSDIHPTTKQRHAQIDESVTLAIIDPAALYIPTPAVVISRSTRNCPTIETFSSSSIFYDAVSFPAQSVSTLYFIQFPDISDSSSSAV